MEKLGIAADPSIQTWLHKIKQHAFEEEEEDDYDFVDEMSGNVFVCSQLNVLKVTFIKEDDTGKMIQVNRSKHRIPLLYKTGLIV